MKSVNTLWQHDLELLNEFPILAGVDEVGRGPLAGNVVAGAVILDFTSSPLEVNDSKKLSEKKREHLFGLLPEHTLCTGIGVCTPEEIDRLNILQASLLAMKRALEACGRNPDLVLVDGNQCIPGLDRPQRTVIKGDSLSASIASSSILAKVTRDRYMKELHQLYPEYNFSSNKGYGTKEHIEAIRSHGYSPVHRRSFQPASLKQMDIFRP